MNISSKNIGIRLLDVFFAAFIAYVLICAFPQSAYAYVDPSVMTYTIQAVAGVAVALSAVAGVAWRRLKRRLYRALDIDENAGKIVEYDIRRISPDEEAAADKQAKEFLNAIQSVESTDKKEPLKLQWPIRILISAIASFCLVFMVFFVTPCEIVAANSNDIVYGLGQVWPIMAIECMLLFAIIALALSAFRGKAFIVAVACVMAIALGCYMQAMFLNVSLPPADGTPLEMQFYKRITVVSAAVWICLIALMVVLAIKKPRAIQLGGTFICIALIVVQAAAVVSIFVEDSQEQNAAESNGDQKRIVTEEGLFQVSDKNNVVVFVLDTTDTKKLVDIQAEYPQYFSELTGATMFSDVAGGMIPTRYGLPFILTGQTPSDYETFADYLDGRYANSSFLSDVAHAGYSVGLYSDSIREGKSTFGELTLNIVPFDQFEANKSMDYVGTALQLSQCALYRDMPWILKPFFWFYTDDMNNAMTGGTGAEVGTRYASYTLDDAKYFSELNEMGLQIEDESIAGEHGAFRLIHLQGSHRPYIMDENAQLVESGESDELRQTLGSFTIVDEYVKRLKELGVYDQTTIVITSDHGNWYVTPGIIEDATNPIMIVKPAVGDAGSFEGAMRVSNNPISHEQLQATIVAAMYGNADSYGNTVFDATEEGTIRYHYMTSMENMYTDSVIREFAIMGNALDFNNWYLTGREWMVDDR